MRTLVGLLMVLIVSAGNNEVTIEGILGEDVLLPCTCSGRNLSGEFKWQMDEPKPNKAVVFIYNGTTSDFGDRYRGRAKVFVAENSSNCSLLLTNVTANDQGKYKCSFNVDMLYTRTFIHLKMSAKYSVCQRSDSNLNGNVSVKVFRCDVKGRHRAAEILWRVEGAPLTNSPTAHITHMYPTDAPTGFYHFKSELVTELSWPSPPKCDVMAEGISSKVSNDCAHIVPIVSEKISRSMAYFALIPIVLVLVLCLVLWRHWKISQNLPRIRGAQTRDELQCENFPLKGG